MDITLITQSIDAEIVNRRSKNFGIKVGFDLFKDLKKAGHISIKKFGIMGTHLFEHEQYVYEEQIPIFVDFDIDGYEFTVGIPEH